MTAAPSVTLTGAADIDGTTVFAPLVLSLPGGSWTCLLGPSGVGKSTVLRLIAGLGDEVLFEGTLAAGDNAPLTGRVALMAQDDLLLPWLDVATNVALGAKLRGAPVPTDRVAEVLSRVGLSEHSAKTPDALSGGQRQRVALARTLLEDRPVVLLDEPFSALDARSRALMQDLAHEVLSGRTVLHVTHDAAEAARLGERVLVMTSAGLCHAEPPSAPTPRIFDAEDTLAFQGRLLRQLMEAA